MLGLRGPYAVPGKQVDCKESPGLLFLVCYNSVNVPALS